MYKKHLSLVILLIPFMELQASADPLPMRFSQTLDTQNRELVRQFYNVVYSASDEVDPQWTGSISDCDPGSVSDEYQQATLRRINWYRAMSGVPAEVFHNPSASAKAQQAALMMSANFDLDHNPPSFWTCYTQEGNLAAQNSNLSSGSAGPDAVLGQFRDHGEGNTAVGHRRWLQFPITPSMGVGSVTPKSIIHSYANAIWVNDYTNIDYWWSQQVPVRDDFVAWPAPGYVPYNVVYPRWSFSYHGADFSSANVTMHLEGNSLDVTLEPVEDGFGLNTLVWIPEPYQDGDSWSHVSSDETYDVKVSNVVIDGVSRNFQYQVTVIDPAVSVGNAYEESLYINGPGRIEHAQPASFSADGVDYADEYSWRLLSLKSMTKKYNGQTGLDGLTVQKSQGYDAVSTNRYMSYGASYHLAHTEATDQSIILNERLAVGSDSRLSFHSYLGFATDIQVAYVELSTDEGATWQTLWEQAGSGAPQLDDFQYYSIDLSDFRDKTALVRFRYAFDGSGTYYPQSNTSVGWYIDNIQLRDVDQVLNEEMLISRGSPEIDILPSQEGIYGIQLSPNMFGGFSGEWGELKRVAYGDQYNLKASKKRILPIWLFVE